MPTAQNNPAPSWDQVSSSPTYTSLPPEQQEVVRNGYFNDFVAPNVPQEILPHVKASFDADTLASPSQTSPGFLNVAGQAALRGAIEGGQSVAQAATPFKDRPSSAPNDYVGELLNQPISKGWNNPDWWAANILHGAAETAPSLALGVVGGVTGGIVAPESGPVGPLAGSAAGFGLGSAIQEIAPAYQRARESGLSHDQAVDQALKDTGISGAFGTVMGAAPALKVFGKTAEGALKRPISEALAQIFGVVPSVGAAQQVATTEVDQGRLPTPDELGTGYAQNVGVGLGLAGSHAAIRAIKSSFKAPPPSADTQSQQQTGSQETPSEPPAEPPAPAGGLSQLALPPPKTVPGQFTVNPEGGVRPTLASEEAAAQAARNAQNGVIDYTPTEVPKAPAQAANKPVGNEVPYTPADWTPVKEEPLSLVPKGEQGARYEGGIDYSKPQPEAPKAPVIPIESARQATSRVTRDQNIASNTKQLGDATMPEGFTDSRLKRLDHRNALKFMTKDLTEGGDISIVPRPGARRIANTGDVTQDFAQGDTIRTPSINPDWFKTMNENPDTKMTVGETKIAVQKALTGQKLGVRQASVVTTMLDHVTGERTAPPSLEAAQRLRRDARLGLPPIDAYDKEAEQNAGQLLNEQEYPAHWNQETRAFHELATEAQSYDPDTAEKIVENVAHERLPEKDAASQLWSVIQKGRSNVQKTQTAAGESRGQGSAGENAGESGQGTHASAPEEELNLDIPGITTERRAQPRGSERRVDTEQRKAVSQMSPDEMRNALLTSDLTGLPNERAYNEKPRKKYQAFFDLDNFKKKKDELSYKGADQLLTATGHVMKDEAQGTGVYPHHLHGDEFILEGDDQKELANISQVVRDRLAQTELDVTHEDGRVITMKGIHTSYGIGRSKAEAEAALKADKKQRAEQGLRTERGGEHSGLVEPSTTGGEDNRGKGAAEEAKKQVADETPVKAGVSASDAGQSLTVHMSGQPDAREQYNALTKEWNAAVDAKDQAKIDELRPKMEKLRQEAMRKDNEDFKKRIKEDQSARIKERTKELKESPVGARARPSEFPEERGLYWEKTGEDEWTGRGDWHNQGKTITTADLADRGGYAPIEKKPSIDQAAHEAATSPHNDHPEPTEAQKSAGNYKVGKVAIVEKPSQPQPAMVADFGSKIEGARKDYAQTYAEKMNDAAEADIAKVPLSHSWPEPDYKKLLEEGADPWIVGFIRAARDEIPTKPQSSWKLSRWVGQVHMLRDMAHELLDGDISKERLQSEMSKTEYESLQSTVGKRADLYEAVGHDMSLKGIRLTAGQYSILDGKEINPPRIIYTVERKAARTAFSNFPQILARGDTEAEAIANFKKKIAEISSHPDDGKRIKLLLWRERGNDKVMVGVKRGRDYITLETYDDVKAARKAIQDDYDALTTKLKRMREIPYERRETNNPRVGVDHRDGADVTPDKFQEAFGFRGGQFGNTILKAQSEAQQKLNETYDALMDLAGILDLPPKALSLNGELAIAFGARGTGGKNAPSAHYEPSDTVKPNRVVINLTRKRGAGSLAHEWWHAIDNYFTRLRNQKGPDQYLTESAYDREPGVRPQMVDAFRRVVQAVNSTGLKIRSKQLDRTRTKPYWATGREMTARSFESYVIEKLKDQGASNDYLANIVSKEYWDAATALGIEKDGTYPYLEAAEIPAIRAAYDHFFQTIETKETNQGTSVYEPKKGYTATYERENPSLREHSDDQGQMPLDLLAPTDAPAETAREQARDNFKVRYKQVEVGKIRSGITNVKSAEDAAHILAPIRKNAQEKMVALVLGKDGKALQVILHSKGQKDGATVSAVEMAGAIAATDGAKSVWFGHNHPSGDPSPSYADKKLTSVLTKSLEGSGIRVDGHVILGSGARAYHLDEYGNVVGNIKTKPLLRRDAVSITERVIRRVPKEELTVLDSPSATRRAVLDLDVQNGLLLLNNRHALIGVLPISPEEMMALKQYDQPRRILRALDETNSAATIIVATNESGSNNLGHYLARLNQMRVLDAVIRDKSGVIYSSAERGTDGWSADVPFFSRSTSRHPVGLSKDAALPIVSRIAKRLRLLGKVRILIHENEGNLYARAPWIKTQAEKDGATGQVKAVFDPLTQTIHLVASKFADARDIEEAILHEASGHFGLKKLLGKDYTIALNRLYLKLGADKGIRQVADKYGIDMKPYLDTATDRLEKGERSKEQVGAYLADELLARMHETKASEAFPDRIVRAVREFIGAVRNALGKMGFMDLSKATDADLAYIMSKSAQSAREGKKADISILRDEAPMFSRTQRTQGAGDEPMFSRSAKEETTSDEAATEIKKKARSGFKARAQQMVDSIDHWTSPITALPEADRFATIRNLAQGKIAKWDEVGSTIAKMFYKGTKEDQAAVYDYLTTKGADAGSIADKEVRQMAVKAKSQIMVIGKALVDKGVIPEEARQKYEGAYLPRVYFSYLLGDDAILGAGTGRKIGQMGYAKSRKDIPQEIRDVFLGEVKDPAYLAARAVSVPMRDLAMINWMEQIAGNDKWVMPDQMIDWKLTEDSEPRRVTPFWLKAQAEGLRKRAALYDNADNKKAAYDLANRMDSEANDVLSKLDLEKDKVPKGYAQMPDSPRYGALRGLVVRKEIYDDIVGVAGMIPKDAPTIQRIFGFGGIGTKVTQVWKWGKVAANPPAQVRNFVSNMIMLNLSGVPLHKLPGYFVRAIQDTRSKGKYFQIAKKHGVNVSTFAANEFMNIEKSLLKLESQAREGVGLHTLSYMASLLMDKTGKMYQWSETVGKTMKIMHGMEKKWLSEDAAVNEANKWLFDYSEINPTIRYLRNAPVGAPFATYMVKALPRMIEVATKNPMRFAPYAALMMGLPALLAAQYGVGDDDMDALKQALPEWLRKRGNVLPIPWKDEKGRWQFFDAGYFFPWTAWTGMATSLANGDFKDAFVGSGLLGGPIPELITAITTGKDAFTGRDIIDPSDPPTRQFASIMSYLYGMMMPPWLVGAPIMGADSTFKGFAGHLYNALTDHVDKFGDPTDTLPQALMRMAGVNAYPIDPEHSRGENLRRMKFEIQQIRQRATQVVHDRNLSPDERKKIMGEYRDQIQKKTEDMQKYAKASIVNPRLVSAH